MLQLVDTSGNLTPAGQQLQQQISAVLAKVAVTYPWLKWFGNIAQNVNAANDLALLSALQDKTRGGEIRDALELALQSAFLKPNERQMLESVLPFLRANVKSAPETLSLAPNVRPAAESVLSSLKPNVAPADQSGLMAVLARRNDRTDFRAFVLEDTHANRANYPAAAFAIGQLFWETDRTLLYVVQLVAGVSQWVYAAGQNNCAQANIPADLGTNDAGALVGVTDYAHLLKWGGAAYDFAPGDPGGGFIQGFEQAPSNPTAWVACTGQGAGTVNYLKKDGTLGTNTNALPAAASGYLKFAAAYNAARASTQTDLANTGASVTSTSGSVNAGTGAPATFLTSVTFHEGNHRHNLTTADLAGVDLIPYFRV